MEYVVESRINWDSITSPHPCMPSTSYSACKFQPNFFVWNTYGLTVCIVCQITQMDQKRQYVISAPDTGHIILESTCVNGTVSTTKHLDDCLL